MIKKFVVWVHEDESEELVATMAGNNYKCVEQEADDE